MTNIYWTKDNVLILKGPKSKVLFLFLIVSSAYSDSCKNLTEQAFPKNLADVNNIFLEVENCIDQFNIQQEYLIGGLIALIIFIFVLVAEIKSKRANKKITSSNDLGNNVFNSQNNEISSNPITQKIDLLIAYINMEEYSKARKLAAQLEKQKLNPTQTETIKKLKKGLTK